MFSGLFVDETIIFPSTFQNLHEYFKAMNAYHGGIITEEEPPQRMCTLGWPKMQLFP